MPGAARWRGLRIGVLGGSFNPAHGGHRHISLMALRVLALDEVWWLVSPQNPLKPVAGMAPLADRLAGALVAAGHPRIRVSDLEARLGLRYTCDTLAALKARFAQTRFVWLMGADNLIDIARWKRWPEIFETVPVAVFGRPTYSIKATASRAAQRFSRFRLPANRARTLADKTPPAWLFWRGRLHPASASALRAAAGRAGI
jgi:nicotinate-nucleotide adenylyltransferase